MFSKNFFHAFMGGILWTFLITALLAPAHYSNPLTVFIFSLAMGFLFGTSYALMHLITNPSVFSIVSISTAFMFWMSVNSAQGWLEQISAITGIDVFIFFIKVALLAFCTWAFTDLRKRNPSTDD